MFSLSFGEILVIGAILLILIKPEELPGIFRKIGKILADVKKIKDEFKQMAELKTKENPENDNDK